MAGVVLGIDVGTSGLKAVMLDAQGSTTAEATAGYELHSPRPGWTEQDPDDWWSAMRTALAQLWGRGIAPASVEAIGVAGQMHSLVLLDQTGGVVAPAILWSDQRTAAECQAITERIGASELLARTGNPALPGFTAPKLLWVRKNWPEAFARTDKILLAKDFIR